MSDRKRRPGRRAPRRLTAQRLERLALYYLERYETTEARLRQVLERHLWRATAAGVAEIGEAEIAALTAKMVRNGLVDDARFAVGRAASLARRGAALAAIRRRLAVAGVAEETAATALEALGTGAGDELARAAAFARRRRLGPFRTPKERDANKKRDLAALGRQGFGYDTAQRVLEAADPETLEALITEMSCEAGH